MNKFRCIETGLWRVVAGSDLEMPHSRSFSAGITDMFCISLIELEEFKTRSVYSSYSRVSNSRSLRWLPLCKGYEHGFLHMEDEDARDDGWLACVLGWVGNPAWALVANRLLQSFARTGPKNETARQSGRERTVTLATTWEALLSRAPGDSKRTPELGAQVVVVY